jgi:hypothetical protein
MAGPRRNVTRAPPRTAAFELRRSETGPFLQVFPEEPGEPRARRLQTCDHRSGRRGGPTNRRRSSSLPLPRPWSPHLIEDFVDRSSEVERRPHLVDGMAAGGPLPQQDPLLSQLEFNPCPGHQPQSLADLDRHGDLPLGRDRASHGVKRSPLYRPGQSKPQRTYARPDSIPPRAGRRRFDAEVSQATRNAESTFQKLASDRDREIAELLFKALTDTDREARAVRRPVQVKEICALTAADEASRSAPPLSRLYTARCAVHTAECDQGSQSGPRGEPS